MEKKTEFLSYGSGLLSFKSTARRLIRKISRLAIEPGRIFQKLAQSRNKKIVLKSGLFDREWYLGEYPDVARQGSDPLVHYLQHGAFEGRDPGPCFESRGYLKNYPDVATSGLNPLLHYIEHGIKEGRDPKASYEIWIRNFEPVSAADRTSAERLSAGLVLRPLISIIMPVCNTKRDWLERAIESVRRQIYANWQLCISDEASTDAEVRAVLDNCSATDKRIQVVHRDRNGHISVNSNTALELATGEFIVLMDADDELSEYALFWVAREINRFPEADLIYSDEDQVRESGKRYNPYFKPDWNPALLLSQNFFCHLGVYRRSLVQRVGGFRLEFEGAQDHDLALRCSRLTTAERIRHIPRVLYHRRAVAGSRTAQPYAWEAGARAIKEHLNLLGINARVAQAGTQFFQVDYELRRPFPKISIVVPTTLDVDLIQRC